MQYARDEYGWICEYSSVGMEPKKRDAIIRLIVNDRLELLRKLIRYPNPQTQVYAADALIFIDIFYKIRIENERINLNNEIAQLDSLINNNSNSNKIQTVKEISNIKKVLLISWKNIY